MKPHSESLKQQLFRRLRAFGDKAPYVSIQTIRQDLESQNLKLSPDLLREYLSEAMAQGVIHDAGRGWYSPLAERAMLSPEAVEPLRTELAKRFPFLPHYLWSSLQFNPWMHHLIGKPAVFVHAESEGLEDVAGWLRQQGWNVFSNPTAKTGKDFAAGDRVVVLRGILRGFDPATEPRVETALVDLLLENSRLHLMDEGERRQMSRNLLTTCRVEMAGLSARLRDHKKSLADLTGDSIRPIIAEI